MKKYERGKRGFANSYGRKLDLPFLIKASGQLLYTSPKVIDIGVTLNHWVHHRGQLTVYICGSTIFLFPPFMALPLMIKILLCRNKKVTERLFFWKLSINCVQSTGTLLNSRNQNFYNAYERISATFLKKCR